MVQQDGSIFCPPERDSRYSKECEQCRQLFFRFREASSAAWENHRFCSPTCKGLASRKRDLIQDERGRQYDRRFSRECECCGATYFKAITVSLAKWAKSRFCSQSCTAKGCQNGKETQFKLGMVPANKRFFTEAERQTHNREWQRQYYPRWSIGYRERRNELARLYYYRDLERSRARSRERMRAYIERGGEAYKERRRQYNTANREHFQELQKAWRRANPERAAAKDKRYRDRHPEKIKEWKRRGHHKRRALLRGATCVERIDFAYIRQRDKDICQICKNRCVEADMTFDHIIPLAHNGPHTNANLRVAHARCNSRRGAGRIPAQILLPIQEKV